MKELLKQIKKRIEYLEKVAPEIESNQQESIMIELKHADEILKRMSLLCMVISK